MTSPVLFAKALLRPQIKWKNGYYRLKWGGLAEVIKTSQIDLPVSSSLAVNSDLSASDRDEFRLDCAGLQPPALPTERPSSSLSFNVQEVPSEGRFDLSEESSPSSKSTAYRSRHVRSRSLPQRNPLAFPAVQHLAQISQGYHLWRLGHRKLFIPYQNWTRYFLSFRQYQTALFVIFWGILTFKTIRKTYNVVCR